MGRNGWIRPLFIVAALYDGVLGLLFIFAPLAAFNWFSVVPPNHVGYVQFPAALLVVFAVMFARIAADPLGQRNLIPYGIGLKIAYCATVFFHWAATGIPPMWKPFAIADLLFMAFFFAGAQPAAQHRPLSPYKPKHFSSISTTNRSRRRVLGTRHFFLVQKRDKRQKRI